MKVDRQTKHVPWELMVPTGMGPLTGGPNVARQF